MKEDLKILERAISDVGYWCWWNERFPEVFQIEFDATLLWKPPTKEGRPPSGKISLRFSHPYSISFLVKKDAKSDLPSNWFDLLRDDAIEPFTLDYDKFEFNNFELVEELIRNSKSMSTAFGFAPNDVRLKDVNFVLAFWAGEVGVIIGADNMTVVNHLGDMKIEDVKEMNRKWWEYWRTYWALRDTPNALPKDYTCEVTIPLATE